MSKESNEVKSTLKVGDKIVLSYLMDMEPGVIRKIAGDKALIDIGAEKLYGEEIKNLIKVESEAQFESQEVVKEESSLKRAVDKIEEIQKVEDTIHKVISSIKFEDEVQDGINNLGEPTEQLSFEDPKIGNKVRKIGTKRIGSIISLDSHTKSYRVKWDDNTITTNWKQELTVSK